MIEIIKRITFDLNVGSNTINMPYFQERGYARSYVLALFKELQEKGYGEFKLGTRGRGQCHCFIKNSKCPDTYIIEIEEKPRGRTKKNASIKSETIDHNLMAAEPDEITSEIYNKENKIAIQTIENTDLSNIASDLSVTAPNITLNSTDNAIINDNEDEESINLNDEIPF